MYPATEGSTGSNHTLPLMTALVELNEELSTYSSGYATAPNTTREKIRLQASKTLSARVGRRALIMG